MPRLFEEEAREIRRALRARSFDVADMTQWDAVFYTQIVGAVGDYLTAAGDEDEDV